MDYNKEFEKIIDECVKHNQYVGLGNPNAKILLVGKEAGSPVGSKLNHGSGESWKENKIDYSRKFTPTEPKLKNNNHTWQKYQKLHDIILEKLNHKDKIQNRDAYEITFVENVFTTELSNLPAPKTSDAKKQKEFEPELEKRKKVFWKNQFIKQFPIVIIAASDNKYIETYSGEVCELFDVEFSEQFICAKSDKLWIHHAVKGKNDIFPKLLIHTRQLTNGASNELIDKIAELVADFAIQHSIDIS